MSKHVATLIFPMLMTTLTACSPAVDENDPYRIEFVSACNGLATYRSMQPDKRMSMCKCMYDTAMQGLSEQEKNGARFYLLEQAGVDTKSKKLATIDNMDVIGTAAKAVGNAVKQCPRR